jgi:quercetin dioxygenase-like cupin family protein
MAGTPRRGFRVARGEDRIGKHAGAGIGTVAFKVATADSAGALLAVELDHRAKGGPPRHIHHNQDEWFYVLEGDYLLEVGDERFRLGPGDSAFGPRGVPHRWACVGEGGGRIAMVFTPAGEMEAFFGALGEMDALAPQEAGFWPRYAMELVGPPLSVE